MEAERQVIAFPLRNLTLKEVKLESYIGQYYKDEEKQLKTIIAKVFRENSTNSKSVACKKICEAVEAILPDHDLGIIIKNGDDPSLCHRPESYIIFTVRNCQISLAC